MHGSQQKQAMPQRPSAHTRHFFSAAGTRSLWPTPGLSRGGKRQATPAGQFTCVLPFILSIAWRARGQGLSDAHRRRLRVSTVLNGNTVSF